MMRTPDSLEEYEHMLNAAGWSERRERKQGTLLRRNQPEAFQAAYRHLVEARRDELESRLEVLGQTPDGPHLVLQRRVCAAELTRRIQQLEACTVV